MKFKVLLASIVAMGSISLSAYTYEVQPLVGQNFTEDNSAVDDSTAFGLRINKYISEDNAIMFGYSRIIDADYKKSVYIKNSKSLRSCGTCAPVYNKCQPKDDGNTNSAGYNSNNDENSAPASNPNQVPQIGGSNNSAGYNSNSDENSAPASDLNQVPQIGGNPNQSGVDTDNSQNQMPSNNSQNNNDLQPHQPSEGNPTLPKKPSKQIKPAIGTLGNSSKSKSTDIDRFYINGLHNINLEYNRLTPYVYAGFGYERVDDEFNDYKSQGFFDAGMGLKFSINNKVSLLADIQGIKKFRDNDLDLLASIGLGFFFGADHQIAPEVKAVTTPKPVREVTVIKVKPKAVSSAEVIQPALPAGEYYIQLAAAFKTDLETGCHYTDELQKEGIDYDIKYTTIRGKNASILVVGPYNSKEEAKEDLAKIRKISKNAYIRKIKE